MADRLISFDRSAHMARIRSKHTRPEIQVRQILHAMGYRFRLHRRDLPGSPDIVLPRFKALIHVHGCFWHQHAGCRLARLPKARPEYWLPKLARNVERDEKVLAEAETLGWKPLVVWECETQDSDLLKIRLRAWLSSVPVSPASSACRAAAARRAQP